MNRPWGQETVLHSGDYLMKRLDVSTGERLSLQLHELKTETLFVHAGRPVIQVGELVREYGPGAVVHIPAGTVHRIAAPYCDVSIVEASTPHLDDTIRLEDDYGRA